MADERDEELIEEVDDEAELETEHATGRTGFLTGLVIGALLGAGAALLMAPERGRVTRKRLAKTARRLADDTREHVEEWASDAKDEVRRRGRRLRKRLRR